MFVISGMYDVSLKKSGVDNSLNKSWPKPTARICVTKQNYIPNDIYFFVTCPFLSQNWTIKEKKKINWDFFLYYQEYDDCLFTVVGKCFSEAKLKHKTPL